MGDAVGFLGDEGRVERLAHFVHAACHHRELGAPLGGARGVVKDGGDEARAVRGGDE